MQNSSRQYEQIYLSVSQIISDYLRLEDNELQPDSHIVDDLGADSLALVELGFQISEKFNVPMVDTSDDKLIIKHLVFFIQKEMDKTA